MKAEEAKRDFAKNWGYTQFADEVGKEVTINKTNECLSALNALLDEHYYPKEFMEWAVLQGIMGIPNRKGYLYSSALLNLRGFKGDTTIENLYNYWKENEQ